MTTKLNPVIFYIDGFNFYYGLRNGGDKWKRFYWIDLVKLCQAFIYPDEEIICVKYYTARPRSIGKRERQNTLMKVNKGINQDMFKIHYGKYTEKEVECLATCGETFKTWEEKQTDVHIAVDILEDYMLHKCGKTILISADSDLLPPIRSILRLNESMKTDHKVEIIFPPNQFSSAIQNSPFSVKQMKNYKSRFNRSLLPYDVKTPTGKVIIPYKWRNQLEGSSSSHRKS